MKLPDFFLANRRKWILAGLLASSLLAISACQSTQFLWQAARGQWQIYASGKSVQEVIADPATPASTASQLQFVATVTDYAEQKLYLPVNSAYKEYVDLNRRYVVWNLFVTPELALSNQTWCYPVAGCVAYQGYFSEQDAMAAAKKWQQKDFDTYIGGVAAYSTLGWFNDPILNTFLFYDPISLAALLFHELAHSQLYVRNDTTFNESWATAVEHEAVEQFLQDFLTSSSPQRSAHAAADNSTPNMTDTSNLINPAHISLYKARYDDRQVFVELVQATIEKLEKVYRSNADAERKRHLKADLLSQLQQQYQLAVAENKISNRYQKWFSAPLNNAKLSTVSNYHQWVPALRFKIRSLNWNWQSFYRWSAGIAELEQTQRNAVLEELTLEARQEKMLSPRVSLMH